MNTTTKEIEYNDDVDSGIGRFDYVIASAKKHGIKVLPVFTNNWRNFVSSPVSTFLVWCVVLTIIPIGRYRLVRRCLQPDWSPGRVPLRLLPVWTHQDSLQELRVLDLEPGEHHYQDEVQGRSYYLRLGVGMYILQSFLTLVPKAN